MHSSTCAAAIGTVDDGHDVALVAHDAADAEALRSRVVGEPSGVVGVAPAPRQPDVHVDEHLADARGGRGIDRRFTVDRDRDPRVGKRSHRAEPLRVDALVREQEVFAEPGLRHADHLEWRRARERAMAHGELLGGERGALVRLHMRTAATARERGRHGGEVVLQIGRFDDQCGGLELGEAHERRR